MTLADFLLARIAEDEAQAVRSKATNAMNPNLRIPAGWIEGVADRMLAECEAKRRIVDLRVKAEVPAHPSSFVRGQDDGFRQGLDEALRALAVPYADHPDYDEAWKS